MVKSHVVNGVKVEYDDESLKSDYGFSRSFLFLITLWFISRKPSCGYGIMKRFQAEELHTATPSRMYPILSAMESDGLLSCSLEPVGRRKRKVYSITAKGRKTLKFWKSMFFNGMKHEFFSDMLR
ncbi:MAG: PadR family transcriptional regulator [Candidatus Micrarchaeia archaeon]